LVTSRADSLSVIFRSLKKREPNPVRVVVEVASPEVVRRLENENAQLRKELGEALSRVDALHRTLYEFMGVVNDLKRDLKR